MSRMFAAGALSVAVVVAATAHGAAAAETGTIPDGLAAEPGAFDAGQQGS